MARAPEPSKSPQVPIRQTGEPTPGELAVRRQKQISCLFLSQEGDHHVFWRSPKETPMSVDISRILPSDVRSRSSPSSAGPWAAWFASSAQMACGCNEVQEGSPPNPAWLSFATSKGPSQNQPHKKDGRYQNLHSSKSGNDFLYLATLEETPARASLSWAPSWGTPQWRVTRVS